MDEEDDQHRVAPPRAGRRARAMAAREAPANEMGDGEQQQEQDEPGPVQARRGGFGFDDPPADEEQGSGSSPPRGGEDSNSRTPPPANVDLGGKQFTGVSRRKQDQRVREDEEKEKVQSKYDDMADRGNADGIMEIEEEGKEDMSHMVSENPMQPCRWEPTHVGTW